MMEKQVTIALLCLGLAGCGYQPLYGTSSSSKNVPAALASVSVKQQKTRSGQLVRNEIISLIGKKQSNAYLLGFVVKNNDANTAKSFDSDVLRKSYKLSAKFTLTEKSSGKVVHRGSTFAHVSYDKTAAAFSDYQAKIDAQQRAAKQIGNDIHTRIATYFASN